MQDQDWPNAMKSFRTALSEFPDDATAIVGLGDVYSALKQYESAIRAYQKALKMSPNFYPGWRKIGDTLNLMGKSTEAIKTYI